MSEKTVKLKFLPEGKGGVIDALREIGERIHDAMNNASKATRGLSAADGELKNAIEECKTSIAQQERDLSKLGSAYLALGKEEENLEKHYWSLIQTHKELAEEAKGGLREVVVEDMKRVGAEIEATKKKLDECRDSQGNLRAAIEQNHGAIIHSVSALREYEKKALAARQATIEEAKARREAAQAAKEQKEAVRAAAEAEAEAHKRSAEMQRMFANRVREAQARSSSATQTINSFGISLGTVRAASIGASHAQHALAQMMNGNLIGAFRSATAATQAFSKACGALGPIGAIVAALAYPVYSLAKGWTDAKKAAEEYAQVKADLANRREHLNARMEGRDEGLAGLSDAELEARRKAAADKALEADYNHQYALDKADRAAKREGEGGWMLHSAAAAVGWFPFVETPKEEQERLDKREREANAAADAAHEELKAIEAEQARRRGDKKTGSKSGGSSSRASSDADRRARELEQIVAMRKENERAREQANIEALNGDQGRLKGLEYRREELRKDRAEIGADFRRLGMALDPEDEKKILEIDNKILQVNQQISAERERLRKARDSEAMEGMSLGDKRDYLKLRMAESLAEAKKTGNNIDRETAKDYERQLKTVEESIKKIGDTRREQAHEYRLNRAFEEKSEKDKLDYLQKEAQYLRGRMAAETDPEKRGKIWDRLFENRKTYNQLKDEAKTRNETTEELATRWQNRDAGAAGRLAELYQKIANASKDPKSAFEAMLEARGIVDGIQEQNMSWVDRKKAYRAAKKQAKADLKAAEEMDELLDSIDGGGSNTLRARSARRMGGKLTGFSRHPNDMASRSAARMSAMRAGILRDYKPGAQGLTSSGKTEEAKGIDKTNSLLEEIRNELR